MEKLYENKKRILQGNIKSNLSNTRHAVGPNCDTDRKQRQNTEGRDVSSKRSQDAEWQIVMYQYREAGGA